MNHYEPLEALCATAADVRPVPKTVLVTAHPDDEAVGAGARLPRLREAVFVHVTDGSPRDLSDAHSHGFTTREEYAQARRQELRTALGLAGIGPEQTRELDCVDQEATRNLVGLSRALANLLREIGPEIVMTHPYEGGHPDHDATAFTVHAACRLLERQGARAPMIIEMTSYHNGPNGITTGEFLPNSEGEVVTCVLSEGEREFKKLLLTCYTTQRDTLQYFPVGVERFRFAPHYDFTRPPHEGLLFYECFQWGMTGTLFRDLARTALAELGIQEETCP